MRVFFMMESGCDWRWYAESDEGDPLGRSGFAFPTLPEAQQNFELVCSDKEWI
ncbi:hypothetical protein [Sphingosinicella xenopeptidilytica]|uniref:DUF2188 domain-containing protein n=1 Tax=Sphingosinicella xenopeptidilytica TaxID=364098 RepID=A0ABW3C6F1_SPHXN